MAHRLHRCVGDQAAHTRHDFEEATILVLDVLSGVGWMHQQYTVNAKT
jgi:hypothetical protein